MVPGKNDDVTIPIPEEEENVKWLIEITEEKDPQSRDKPLIQKVPETLWETESNRRCFTPRVVSLGPYHHGEAPFMLMERYKRVAARWFLSLIAKELTKEQAIRIYGNFIRKAQASALSPSKAQASASSPREAQTSASSPREVQASASSPRKAQASASAPREAQTSASSPRDCYADKFMDKYNEAHFMKMMFLDGCFILRFVHLVVEESNDLSKSSHCLNQPLIIRDMFLLKNQIPYSILQSLMSILSRNPNKLEYLMMDFIDKVFIPSFDDFKLGQSKSLFSILKFNYAPKRQDIIEIIGDLKVKGQPIHLLDLLRTVLVGRGNSPSTPESCYWHYHFRPISELKADGIQVSRRHSLLRDVEFKKGAIDSSLELPPIVVDDSTKTHMLNLVAYEMCPDALLDRGVTSYICFLDSLIYDAEDVKELRSNNILFNRLGSDKEVADLFKELATNLSPDYTAYSEVIKGIEGHSKRHFNRVRLWIGQLIRTYFTTPWTAIPLTAATFVIIFALVQTIFTVCSFYVRK